MIECNHDCLNCPYPDVPEECLEAPITHEEYKELEEIERGIINPKTAQQRKAAAYQREYYERNKDKAAARQRAYYERNKDKVAARQRAYYERNKDKAAARQRAYYERNKDKVAAYQRAYRERNKDKVAARQRAYYERNKDKVAARQRCIAQVRKTHGMTQAKIAALTGVTRQTISAFERGALVADWDKLCAVLPELEAYRP